MARDDMACRDAVELVTDYLEGKLSPRQRRAFERHLEKCSGCTNYLEQIRETIRLSGEIEADSLPAELRDSLLEAFRDVRRGTS